MEPDMIVLQIRGVRDSLRFRWSEWGCAGVMILWGWIALQPADSFAASPSWAVLQAWAPEEVWGTAALLTGLVRILVLTRNGRWARCHQARLVLAWAACFFWTALVWALVAVGPWVLGIAPYLGLLVLDFGTIYIASYDAARYAEARKNGAA